jgi:hypothetical protein
MESKEKGYNEKEIPKNHFLNKYSLFAPRTSNGLKNDYPELRKNIHFEKLTKAEMLFVWYFSCEASPFANIDDDRVRAKRSIEIAYLKDGRLDIGSRVKSSMENLDFKEYIPPAIHSMQEYKMGPRVREKRMVDRILSNFEAISDMDVTGVDFQDEAGGTDFDKQKKYVDSCKSIISTLPSLNKMAEGNSGLRDNDNDDKDDMSDGSFMDSAMEEN